MDAPDAGPSAPAQPSLPRGLNSAEADSTLAKPSAPTGPSTPPGKQRRRKEHVDYEVLYEAVRDRPLTVESLRFHGLGRTRPELVVREFRRLHRAETLDDVRYELLEAHDALKALGPYDRVEVVLDDSATARSPTLVCMFCFIKTAAVSMSFGILQSCRGCPGRVRAGWLRQPP